MTRRTRIFLTYNPDDMSHVVLRASRLFHSDPQIAALRAQLAEQIRELRFHQALRRRWAQVRAESSIMWAIDSGAADGARMTAADLRVAVARGDTSMITAPEQRWVLGNWRAHSEVVTLMSDLGARRDTPLPPTPALLARLHRDIAATTTNAASNATVGIMRRDARPDLLELIVTLIDNAAGTALVNLALMHAEIVTGELFPVANAAVARALGRLIAQRSGLDPTGCANAAAFEAAYPGRFAAALEGYRTGTPQAVTHWICEYAQAWIYGASSGQAAAQRVLAGRTDLSPSHRGSAPEPSPAAPSPPA